MSRPTAKNDLIEAASSNYAKLNDCIHAMDETALNTIFDFSMDHKKEAHWVRDKNLRDVLVHLHEWHQLVLNWVADNTNGLNKPFIPEPYNWKTCADMNVNFWKKHQNTSLEEATKLFNESHAEIIKLAKSYTNEELFSKNTFKWVGGSTLGSYFVSATASHYDWAMKKLKAHMKQCKAK